MATGDFVITRKYVWVNDTLPNGMIEFEFAVGDTSVSVELVMPKAAFDEFCAANQVEFIAKPGSDPAPDAADADFHWNLHQATHQRFR